MFQNSYSGRGYVHVASGKSNGRSFGEQLMTGRITITGLNCEGRRIKRVVMVGDGEIQDNRQAIDGKLVHRIVYGRFERGLNAGGKLEITRFHRGGTGKHGKARRYTTLFGASGCVHSWYKRGRLVRQKFVYDNGRQAYDYRLNACDIKDHNGKLLYQLKGAIDGRKFWNGHSVFDRNMEDWFLHREPFEVRKNGAVIFAGQYENRQRVGKWVLDGREHYYEHGVAIPKRLFEMPPERLDPVKILSLPNAQLRMAMMAKGNFTAARLAQCGRLVHRQGSMRLYDVKGLDTRILKVVCPSTKSEYHIRVPKDSTRCETARQWTFHVNAGVAAPIQFTKET